MAAVFAVFIDQDFHLFIVSVVFAILICKQDKRVLTIRKQIESAVLGSIV